MRHIYSLPVQGRLQPEVPRIQPPQSQSGANVVVLSMVNMSTTGAGGVITLNDVLCVSHLWGGHECLDRTRPYRHGDTHVKTLRWELQWSTHLECEGEMEHMNGPQVRIYLNRSHLPRITTATGHTVDGNTVLDELRRCMEAHFMKSGWQHRTYVLPTRLTHARETIC